MTFTCCPCPPCAGVDARGLYTLTPWGQTFRRLAVAVSAYPWVGLGLRVCYYPTGFAAALVAAVFPRLEVS